MLGKYCITTTMSKKKSSLADDVAAAFQRACLEDDLEVAEYLLQALELLASREEAEEKALRAYSKLVRSLRRGANH
jgi:hypothetical protein